MKTVGFNVERTSETLTDVMWAAKRVSRNRRNAHDRAKTRMASANKGPKAKRPKKSATTNGVAAAKSTGPSHRSSAS